MLDTNESEGIPLVEEIKPKIDKDITTVLIKEMLTIFKDKKLTPKELAIINIIEKYAEKNGVKITLKKMMIKIGCKSIDSPKRLLNKLIEKKIISKESNELIDLIISIRIKQGYLLRQLGEKSNVSYKY